MQEQEFLDQLSKEAPIKRDFINDDTLKLQPVADCPDVFLRCGPNGQAEYVTTTADGRVIPVDEWYVGMDAWD